LFITESAKMREESNSNSMFQRNDEEEFLVFQKNLILALAQQPYEEHNSNHRLILDNMRHNLATYMPRSTLSILNI